MEAPFVPFQDQIMDWFDGQKLRLKHGFIPKIYKSSKCSLQPKSGYVEPYNNIMKFSLKFYFEVFF